MTLVLLNYNKYKNRQFKREETIADYYEAASAYELIYDYDFNPADGVDTSVILGGEYYDYEDKYDYLIVCEGDEIISRWFIMDANRTRIGQYSVTLHRDCVVDHFDEIIDAPAYIGRATLNDEDPLILTKESFTANEIKTSETLLTDDTQCAWIVGYLARNPETSIGRIEFKADVIEDLTSFDYEDGDQFAVLNSISLRLNIGYYGKGVVHHRYDLYRGAGNFSYVAGAAYTESYRKDTTPNLDVVTNMLTQQLSSYGEEQLKPYAPQFGDLNWTDPTDAEKIKANNGRIVKKDNKFYKINISRVSETKEKTFDNGAPPQGVIDSAMYQMGFTKSGPNAFIIANASVYTVKYEEIQNGSFWIQMPNSENRYNLKDAPYDMFCIPYPCVNGYVTYGGKTITCPTAMQFAQGIAEGCGSALYDLQLLPFCPLTITADGTTLTFDTTDAKRSSIIYKGTGASTTNPAGYILWSTASQGTKTLTNPQFEAGNLKMANQVDKYRIAAGSYGSAFEINIAKNGGKLESFNVDYTYLPYNPYIHINPEFNSLYGADFDDTRGLIDQSDKSISYTSNAWAQYQIQNKNYNNQFDKQIAMMEINHTADMTSSVVSAITGTAAAGLGVGAMINPAAGVGAGVASAVGGAADIAIKNLLYKANKKYTEDTHTMELENIQAMPQSISKLTAYSKNNKIFPLIEYYTCTDREKEAFANYVRNYGMTCGVYGIIRDYLGNSWEYEGIKDKGYIRASIIRAENLEGDNHMLEAINTELQEGVYFK